MAEPPDSSSTLDAEEVARFAKLAGEWWDANGPFKPLHRINPTRLTYIRDQLCRKFGRDNKAAASLKQLTLLDIGWGGGPVVAPLVKPGAIMIVSTLNRTLKAYALAIIGAELILRWLPLGTHNWDRFVTPEELRGALRGAGLTPADTTRLV